jgi:hypothetical protein
VDIICSDGFSSAGPGAATAAPFTVSPELKEIAV